MELQINVTQKGTVVNFVIDIIMTLAHKDREAIKLLLKTAEEDELFSQETLISLETKILNLITENLPNREEKEKETESFLSQLVDLTLKKDPAI